jgi:hypothetical protein
MAKLSHLSPQAGRRRVAELLERFDLVEAARKPLAIYSGGMKRRLDPNWHLWLSIAWCVVMIVGGYAWACSLYLRRSVR